jgi:hypothetical protein
VEETAAHIAVGLFIEIIDQHVFITTKDMNEAKHRVVTFVQDSYRAGTLRQRFLDAAKEDLVGWSLGDDVKIDRCRFPLRFDPGFPLRTDPA